MLGFSCDPSGGALPAARPLRLPLGPGCKLEMGGVGDAFPTVVSDSCAAHGPWTLYA